MLTKIVLVLTLCHLTPENHWPYLENCRVLFVPNKDKAMCERRLKTWSHDKTTIPHYFKGEVPKMEGGEVIVGVPYCETLPYEIKVHDIVAKRWEAGHE